MTDAKIFSYQILIGFMYMTRMEESKTEMFTNDEYHMLGKLRHKMSEYLESIGAKEANSDSIACPSCGMIASIYMKETEWLCEECGSKGDILDYCVLSGLYPDRREALRSLCRKYGIKRSELELMPADSLLRMDIKETPDIIKGILPTGLTLLYGSPKICKSWLVLQMAVAVSKGEDFFDQPTRKGKVVYLALEDTYRRLKSRLSAQTDTVNSDLQFVINSEILGDGLEMQLHNLMQTIPDTTLIIIDTFQRIRSPEANKYSYADDYREVEILQQFAARHEIAIILVHHKRKMKATDPLDEVSGTNGLTGSADTLMLLTKKKRTSRTGKLNICGRDLPGEEYEVIFYDDKKRWEVLSVGEDDYESSNYVVSLTAQFAEDKGEWHGTATELLKELTNLDPLLAVHPNRLSAILFEYRAELLATYKVDLEKERTSKKKTISLIWFGEESNTGGDSSVSNDIPLIADTGQNNAGYISS